LNPFSSINFGLLIAFFLPGIVSLYALGYFSRTVAAIFDSLLNNGNEVGASFLILSASIVAGLIVSSFRGVVLEPLYRRIGVEQIPFDYGMFIEEKWRDALEDLIEQQYRYYQFYGNIMISLLFLLIARVLSVSIWDNLGTLALHGLAVIMLFFSGKDALTDVYATYRDIEKEYEKPQEGGAKSKFMVFYSQE
jgi:hypothetical protein